MVRQEVGEGGLVLSGLQMHLLMVLVQTCLHKQTLYGLGFMTKVQSLLQHTHSAAAAPCVLVKNALLGVNTCDYCTAWHQGVDVTLHHGATSWYHGLQLKLSGCCACAEQSPAWNSG